MWDIIADEDAIKKAVEGMEQRGIKAIVVENGDAAKKKVIEILPEKAEVMDMTSITLQQTGIMDMIRESGKYKSVHKQTLAMDKATQSREMAKLRAAPEWAIGSLQAITEDGQLMIASNTGSQLAAEVYGAAKVIFVVGTQKIVADEAAGLKRIYEYALPHEAERAKQAYGAKGSNVSKLLIINKEIMPDRITVILAKEKLGF